MKLDWSDIGAVSAVVFQGYTAVIMQDAHAYIASIIDPNGGVVVDKVVYESFDAGKKACTKFLEKKDKPNWVKDEEWLYHTTWRGLKMVITPTTFDDGLFEYVFAGHVYRSAAAFRKEFRTIEEAKEGIEKWVRSL